jgi:hypothetical protein
MLLLFMLLLKFCVLINYEFIYFIHIQAVKVVIDSLSLLLLCFHLQRWQYLLILFIKIWKIVFYFVVNMFLSILFIIIIEINLRIYIIIIIIIRFNILSMVKLMLGLIKRGILLSLWFLFIKLTFICFWFLRFYEVEVVLIVLDVSVHVHTE